VWLCTPDATVTGSGTFTARRGGTTLYTGSDYRLAIQRAVDSISSGQRVSVIASGNIGANTITIGSGKTFEGCGTITAGNRSGRGAIDARGTQNVNIPYLNLAGTPSFGMHFSDTRGLTLGTIVMNLSSGSGIGIRFDRDAPMNYDVKMGDISLETWNIDRLTIASVVARNCGECGLLLQKTTNARVGLVDGDNVARGTGYAAFRMANENGRLNGNWNTNVYIDRVKSRGGGRGVFCVSQSGGAEIRSVDLANNGNNAILIENCYNVRILGGTINGGGEVRLAARSEFANNRDISITARVDNTSVRESPCAENSTWNISGNARLSIC
jgi:hypothetical protein